MNNSNETRTAFALPVPNENANLDSRFYGLSKIEYIGAQVLAALYSNNKVDMAANSVNDLATAAYDIAETFLAIVNAVETNAGYATVPTQEIHLEEVTTPASSTPAPGSQS